MSWQDRNYPDDDNPMRGYGKPGGDWQGVRPTFDNPFTWSLPLGRVAGILVRIHVIFLIFIVIKLLQSQFGGIGQTAATPIGFWIMFGLLSALFVVVLLHEFGHCIGCRWVGGEANEILMWPLGGLAYCRPPNHWLAHMITVVAGPMVNVVICLLAGTMLGLLTGRWLGVALPNPIFPLSGLYDASLTSWAHQLLYLINAVSFLLLLFNLLPIFPLDGGRIVQAWMWRSMGYQRSMRIAVRIGFIGAILLGVFGFIIVGMTPYGGLTLVMIALFGGITCWITHKQLAFTEEMMGFEDDDYALSLTYGDDNEAAEEQPAATTRRDHKAERLRQQEEEEAREVDRILDKIARTGIDSLTRSERRILDRYSERKRDSQ
jgi:stage IV sporulation protein FB